MNPFSPQPNSFKAPANQPPTDLNAFLMGIGSTGLNQSGQPTGSTGGTIPLQRSEQDQLTAFTAPSQAGYNGGVTNPLQKLNDLLGIQAPQQEMRVPQSQFALPQGNVHGAVKTPTMGMPSSTPMIGDNSHIKAPAPTPISAFGGQVQEAGASGWSGVAKNGALFSATDNGFSIVQDPNTIPAQGGGLPQFLQGVSPQTIAPVINAMKAGGDPEQVRQALLAGAPVPQGLSAEQQAAWTLEQAALGQQSAALYDQIRASGIGNKQYGQGMLTGAYNQALGSPQGGLPGLTPVQAMAGQAAAQANAKPIKPIEIVEGDFIVTKDANTGAEIGRAPRTPLSAEYQRTAAGGVEPVPGSKEAVAAQAASKKAAARSKKAIDRADIVIGEIDKILPKVNAATAGPLGAGLAYVPFVGQRAVDLAATIETIQSRLAFDELQSIRDTSPTGGALGQVAVKELDLLKASVANLKQTQSPAQLAENLSKVRDHYARWKAAESGVNPDIVAPSREQTTGSQIGAAARQIGRFMVRMAGESK